METNKKTSEKLRVAYKLKSNSNLRKQNLLFYLLNLKHTSSILAGGVKLITIQFLSSVTSFFIKKSLLFNQFCGGETIKECKMVIKKLSQGSVGTILDYSIEGVNDISLIEKTISELKKTVLSASKDRKNIPFGVFKMTALAKTSVLEKLNKEILSNKRLDEFPGDLKEEYDTLFKRVDDICSYANKLRVKVMIDAEESWIQDIIDEIALKMMGKYNQEKIVIINTYQMYLSAGLERLMLHHKKMENSTAVFGVKLVRGAYMEKENERFGINSPVCKSIIETHKNYNNAILYCITNLNSIYTVIGTHNEESIEYAKKIMLENNIPRDSTDIYFAQLFGMGDMISFNLTNESYNVAKYVPYGPVKFLLPYLIRRSQENSSSKNMTNRELKLIREEMRRRKLSLIL